MKKEEVRRLLEKYEHGVCSEAEKKLVGSFLDSYQQETQWHSWKHGDQTVVAQRILDRVKQQQPRSKTRSLKLWRYAAVIAILIAALVGAYKVMNNASIQAKKISKHTLRGQKSTVVLGDGSTIRLNSESALTYPLAFDEEQRVVELSGEAFFEVARDERRPFIIKTGELTTRVLGTSFNIKAFPKQDIEVTVATGKVSVSASTQQVTLAPDQQAVFSASETTLEKKSVDSSKVLAWKSGRIIFDEVPLREAVKILERWYNVDIVLDNDDLATCRIRSEYANENLMGILESMRFIMGIEYRFEKDNTIHISGKSCKTE